MASNPFHLCRQSCAFWLRLDSPKRFVAFDVDFDSTAPIRPICLASWRIDGEPSMMLGSTAQANAIIRRPTCLSNPLRIGVANTQSRIWRIASLSLASPGWSRSFNAPTTSLSDSALKIDSNGKSECGGIWSRLVGTY